jgi:hypothetical protein
MSKPQDNILSVGVIAKQVIGRISQSSTILTSEIKFDCSFCRDTHFEEKDGRHQRCRCRVKSQEEKVGSFLKRRTDK